MLDPICNNVQRESVPAWTIYTKLKEVDAYHYFFQGLADHQSSFPTCRVPRPLQRKWTKKNDDDEQGKKKSVFS